jgi:hypothetical protein
MDLSGVIVIVPGILFFFGGAAWLEIHSRKIVAPSVKVGIRPATGRSYYAR